MPRGGGSLTMRRSPAEIEQQVAAVFGAMRLDGACGTFPMTGLRVSRLTGRRIALLGEAAHVFPPLAAQGLNLSLRDTATLVDCLDTARAKGEDIGAAAALAAYADARRADISLRTHGIDILNRSLLADFLPGRSLARRRLSGLQHDRAFAPRHHARGNSAAWASAAAHAKAADAFRTREGTRGLNATSARMSRQRIRWRKNATKKLLDFACCYMLQIGDREVIPRS